MPVNISNNERAIGARFTWYQRAALVLSCRRIRCITLMILREFVSTMATNSSMARQLRPVEMLREVRQRVLRNQFQGSIRGSS